MTGIVDLTIDHIPDDHPGWDRLLTAVLAEDWAPQPAPRRRRRVINTGVNVYGGSNAARMVMRP